MPLMRWVFAARHAYTTGPTATRCIQQLLVFVNGKLFAEDGKVGKSPGAYTPHWSVGYKALPTGSDTLDIVLQVVANFSHYKVGFTNPCPWLVCIPCPRNTPRSQSIDFLLSGCLYGAFFFFFLAFICLAGKNKATCGFSLSACATVTGSLHLSLCFA